jgi:hypothetical protein
VLARLVLFAAMWTAAASARSETPALVKTTEKLAALLRAHDVFSRPARDSTCPVLSSGENVAQGGSPEVRERHGLRRYLTWQQTAHNPEVAGSNPAPVKALHRLAAVPT